MSSEQVEPGVVVEALGVPIGIPVSGEDAVRLRRQWSRAITDRPATTVIDLHHLDAEQHVAHDYAITSLVTMAALETTAGQRMNIHAGAVADTSGRVLAVVGPSGSGKTTAIRLLAGRLGYVSDETVSVGEGLKVHAHSKPLSVISDPDQPRLKQSVSPDDIGLLRPPTESRLHRIVLLHRDGGEQGLVPLAPAHAMPQIVAQTSSLMALEHPILRLADLIDACGGVWSLHYREIEDRLEELVTLLDRDPQPRPARVHHPGAGSTGSAVVPGTWRRAPWLDAMEYEDDLVVMVGDRVWVLAGLGLVLWLALSGPHTLDELVSHTTDAWGAHPDATQLVSDALALLAEDGLVIGPDSTA